MNRKYVTDVLVGKYLDCLAKGGRPVPRYVRDNWNKEGFIAPLLNQEAYTCEVDFMIDYQATRFVKKLPGLVWGASDEQRRALAIRKFEESERTCSAVNIKLCNKLDVDLWSHLERARGVIRRILGPFSWDVAIRYCDFGPGSSIGVPRSKSHLANKIGHTEPTVTGECFALAEAFIRSAPLMSGYPRSFTIVRGSKTTTVPKDSSIDRLIAIEPLWNMFFQKGIGGLIRHRLRGTSLDLDTQAEKNRELARVGSKTGNLATLDLSSASDSISLELCRVLLPDDWFEAMMLCRSRETEINGEHKFLRKISSMGNGFTFELESLIFLALCISAFQQRYEINVNVAVFGDDLIIPCEEYNRCVWLLSELGFKVNSEKSFHKGSFRESCGGHYFRGFDVTPFHLRKEVTSVEDLYWFANQTREFASRLGGDLYCHSMMFPAHQACLMFIPDSLRSLLIPRGSGDDGIIASFDEACPTPNRDGLQDISFRVRCLQRKLKVARFDGYKALLCKLYCYEHRRLQEGDALARVLDRLIYSRSKVRTRIWRQQWPWLGAWV